VKPFKIALFALLAANAVYFVLSESPSKAIDSCAWLTLLALFEAETSFARHVAGEPRQRAIRVARLFAGAGVVAATIGYVFEDNVLDAANSVLWILVVVLLESELRFGAFWREHPRTVKVVAAILYGGLAVIVLLWAAQGLWFDAYDALLWLVAFVALELAVTRRRQSREPTAASH
jgi:hypothetical protein